MPGHARRFPGFPGHSPEFPEIPGDSREFPWLPVISRGLVNVGALRLQIGESGAAGWCADDAGWLRGALRVGALRVCALRVQLCKVVFFIKLCKVCVKL